jgi:aminopeptidase N
MINDVFSEDNLLYTEALDRAQVVTNVSYKINLDLDSGDDTFLCNSEIEFYAKNGNETFLNFNGDKVLDIELNGKELSTDNYADYKIKLSPLQSHNKVVVKGVCRYQNTGVGLHKFVDPVDNMIYLHTQFEPFDAHRVFACFDQPDIKATFEFTVNAPQGFVIISNSKPIEVPGVTGDEYDGGIWKFAKTKKISTYLAAIIAGNYKGFFDKYRDIDLGIYARRSLLKYIDYEYLFKLTKNGFSFYENKLQTPYPFDKYDQVFVPGFNAGGMENVGCVTYNEAYIFRTEVTNARKFARADTFLHEMSHMWFGDLVTMKWWNDLWLNESLATYMSPLALENTTEFKNAWSLFSIDTKYEAYVQDEMPTTHPIALDVPDTNATRVVFDSITYNKGGSVLKQLVAIVGEEAFFEGIKNYLQKYAFGNPTLDDFIGELQAASGKDLTNWSYEWLETSGVNKITINADYLDCDVGKCLNNVVFTQSKDNSSGIYRNIAVSIGFFDFYNEYLRLVDNLSVEVSNDKQLIKRLENRKAPYIIMPNYNDYAYVMIRLDNISLSNTINSLSQIEDNLSRIMGWNIIWDLVRSYELKSGRWIDTILNHIDVEKDPTILQTLLNRTITTLNQYAHKNNRNEYIDKIYTKAQNIMASAESNEIKLSWFNTFINTSETKRSLDGLKDILSGKKSINGIHIDEDKRWQIIIRLASKGEVDEVFIDNELQKSHNDFTKRYALTAKAAIPNYDKKLWAWRTILEDKNIDNYDMSALIDGFYVTGQDDLLKDFAKLYGDAVNYAWKYKTADEALTITSGLYPSTIVEPYILEIANETLSLDLPSEAKRLIVEKKYNTEIALKAREIDK